MKYKKEETVIDSININVDRRPIDTQTAYQPM